MKKLLLILFLLIAQFLSSAQCYESLKYIKRVFNPDRDNKIYRRERLFQFDYQYTKGDTSYRVVIAPGKDFYLVPESVVDNYLYSVKQISFKVIKPKLFQRTSRYQSETLTTYDPLLTKAWQGLVDNKHNVWLHPPRVYLFRILELNPFPYIKYPLAVGKQWTDSLSIGDHWSDPRWKVWKGRILNQYTYRVMGQTSISILGTTIPCWIIQASAKSSLGTTQLVSYFNEEYGFVQMDYINIDESRITLKLHRLPI